MRAAQEVADVAVADHDIVAKLFVAQRFVAKRFDAKRFDAKRVMGEFEFVDVDGGNVVLFVDAAVKWN